MREVRKEGAQDDAETEVESGINSEDRVESRAGGCLCRCIVQWRERTVGRQMNPAGIWYTPEIAYRSRSQYSGWPERELRIF